MGLFDFFGKKQEPPQPVHIPTLLVVDDEQYLREFYHELLTGEGYTVLTATNGQEALLSAIQNQPALILLDLMMPIMDGLQVLKKLSENDQTKSIPIIVLTNAGSLENMDKTKFYSVRQFFIKSNVSPEEIIKTVKETAPLPTPPEQI